MQSELKQLVSLAAKDTGSRVSHVEDQYRFNWFVLEDSDFEDLVTLLHLVAQTLEEKGYGQQILSAVFRFELRTGSKGRFYLIYNYKRGSFYPFLPVGSRQRDSAGELRVGSIMGKELPVETDVGRWYPVWDCPV